MEDQDLDDLFADPLNEPLNEEQIQQQLENATSVPPPPGLAERVDQLRLNGCSEHIAWSRIGSIAHISRDRREVHLSMLRFRQDRGEWVKADHTDFAFVAHLRGVFKYRELAHVSWNPTSLELLVADVCGRIGLFSLAITLNRAVMAKVITAEQDDSLNALVGMTWLNQKRLVRISKGAFKDGDHWKPNLSSEGARGLSYPTIQTAANKSAVLAVNRKGNLILGYQLLDQSQWADIKHDLDGFSSSGDLLTHAAFCPDTGETSFLVTHTASNKLRIYNINIDWPSSKPAGSGERSSPILTSQYLTTVDACRPATDGHWSMPVPELSHLDIIPKSYIEKGEPEDATHPIIIAGFVGSDGMGNSEPNHTTISRWELKDTTPTIDSSFSQLASKKSNPADLKSEKCLRRLDDLRIDRVVIQMTFQLHNDSFTLCSSDGMVEFRDRKLEVLPLSEKPDQVDSIPQLGFSLSNQKPCVWLSQLMEFAINIGAGLYTHLSPNSMVKAYMAREHELDIAVMQLPTEMIDLGGVATIEKIAMAFVAANTVAEASMPGSSTNDDIIMAFTRFIAQLPDVQQPPLRNMFLLETYRNLAVADKLADMTQLERTLKSGMMMRCHSMQAALGNFGDKRESTLPSKLAMMALNVRHIYIAYMLALLPNPRAAANGLSGPGGPPEPDLNRADVLQYLTHLTGWYMKLTDHIMATLFALNRALDASDGFDADALRLRVAASNDPSLALVCGQFTRALFRHTGLLLRSKLAPHTKNVAWVQPPSPTATHWASFARACKSATIAPPVLETILSELDERCLRAYADAGLSDSQRQDIELDVALRGDLPDLLVGEGSPVAWLLGPALERLRSGSVVVGGQIVPVPERAEADLTFGDWTVLGLGDDAQTKRWRRTTLFDGLQKRVLGRRGPTLKVGPGPGELKVRTCTRCGTSMEDFFPGKSGRNHAVFGNLRMCFCNAHFVTERSEDLKTMEG